MIKSILIENYVGDKYEIPLLTCDQTGLIVKSIEGVSIDNVDISTTDIATADGSYFNNARVGNRNLVLTFIFNDQPGIEAINSVEKIRHLCYRLFPPKRTVKVYFTTDERTSYVEGYVEKNEAEVFSNQETAQVSILCTNPFFQDEAEVSTLISGVRPLFEFPFDIEDGPKETRGEEMGEILIYVEVNVEYNGDEETGFEFLCYCVQKEVEKIAKITFYNVVTREKFVIDITKFPDGKLTLSDRLVISTIRGQKKAILTRGSSTHNVLGCIDRDSTWFYLQPGDNIFSLRAETADDPPVYDYTTGLNVSIVHRPLYEGL